MKPGQIKICTTKKRQSDRFIIDIRSWWIIDDTIDDHIVERRIKIITIVATIHRIRRTRYLITINIKHMTIANKTHTGIFTVGEAIITNKRLDWPRSEYSWDGSVSIAYQESISVTQIYTGCSRQKLKADNLIVGIWSRRIVDNITNLDDSRPRVYDRPCCRSSSGKACRIRIVTHLMEIHGWDTISPQLDTDRPTIDHTKVVCDQERLTCRHMTRQKDSPTFYLDISIVQRQSRWCHCHSWQEIVKSWKPWHFYLFVVGIWTWRVVVEIGQCQSWQERSCRCHTCRRWECSRGWWQCSCRRGKYGSCSHCPCTLIDNRGTSSSSYGHGCCLDW